MSVLGTIVSLPLRLAVKARLISFKTACLLASRIPTGIGIAAKASLLRAFAGHLGGNVRIFRDVRFWFKDPKQLSIGDDTIIERDVMIGEQEPCAHEVSIGRKCIIKEHVRIGAYRGPIIIGDNCGIGYGCYLRGPLKMGNGSDLAPYVVVMGIDHIFDDVTGTHRDKGLIVKEVEIGENVWVGAHCMLTVGIKIGRNTVIGANSVVTHDIPPYCVAGGCPAKIIKRYDFDKNAWVRVSADSEQS